MNGTITFDLTADDGSHITGTALVTSMTVTHPPEEAPEPTTLLETFLPGDKGDFWDTMNPAVCWAGNAGGLHAVHNGQCATVQGSRAAPSMMELRQGGAVMSMPTYDALEGALRFNGVDSERYNDPNPAFNAPLSSTFTYIAMHKVRRGYSRAVMVDHSQELGGANHYPVWFDLRVSQTQAAGWVQDHQFKQPNSEIPWLEDIGGCGTDYTPVIMWREVEGGPAYVHINGQTATVQPGTIVGQADVRLFENENAYDHDFSVRRPYLIDRCLSEAERAIVLAVVSQPPAAVEPPAGGVNTLDPTNNGGLALSNENLTATQSATTWVSTKGTKSVTEGVHAYTAHIHAAPYVCLGVGNEVAPVSSYAGATTDSACHFSSNAQFLPGGQPGGVAGAAAGDTVRVEVDATARTMTISVNGTVAGTKDIAHIEGALFPMVSLHGNSAITLDLSEW